MRNDPRNSLEQRLDAWYRSGRRVLRDAAGADRDACVAACVRAFEDALDARDRRASPQMQATGFLRAQLRFVRPATWAAFALIAALVAVGCLAGGGVVFAPQLLSTAGAFLALACVANVTRARAFGMAELEDACPFNAVSVVLARLLLMGVASVAVFAVGGVASGVQGADAVQAVLWMGAPYLVACAGGLMCARCAASPDARGAAIAWTAGVAAASTALYFVVPAAYASAVVWVWGLTCFAAGLWCIFEVRAWVAESAGCFARESGALGV